MNTTQSFSRRYDASCGPTVRGRGVLVILGITLIMLAFSFCASYATENVYQSGTALDDSYSTSGYELIYNPHVSRAGGGEGRSIMKTVSGPKMEFRTLIYPGISNPQSIAVSPDGNTAWVMNSYKSGNDNSRKGRIYRIDIGRYRDEDADEVSDEGAVTAGPLITTGHGQTLAYDPKTETLWYIRETKVSNTTLVQVDPDTMEIIKEIHFKFSNRVVFPPTFTFDREGNLWTYTRSIGTRWAPAGTIRFYKGTIEDDVISFEMIQQGLRYPPGKYCQSLGYNSSTDRLYVISDGVIFTVPASKLGNITADDVETLIFDGSREFEGMAFDEAGCAYFLTNNPSEIMRDEVSYVKSISEHDRIKEAKEQYDADTKGMEQAEEEGKKEIVREEVGSLLDEGL